MSAAPSETSGPPTCIAPVVIDGGTRFGLELDPDELAEGPAAFRRLLADLREPTTRKQEQRWREQGGRQCRLPMPEPTFWARTIGAAVVVSGVRRESLTFHVEGCAFIRINLETGTVRMQLKARALWAEGYPVIAARWLDWVLWWLTGRRCTLAEAHGNRWRTTGLELCSDFVGLDFRDEDANHFVGFKVTELVRRFSSEGRIETINLGNRRSYVSLCLYDKDVQLAREKDGDDSTYRAHHKAHGWDGEQPRRRVEFRVTGRALQYLDEATGDRLDFRDPAMLANRKALTMLWAVLATKKRLVVQGHTRTNNSAVDPRWIVVQDAAGVQEDVSFRQTREAQRDAWHEASRRARRDARRGLHRVAALHDAKASKGTLREVLLFIQETASTDEIENGEVYQENYRRAREQFMGEEIRILGAPLWAHYVPQKWEH